MRRVGLSGRLNDVSFLCDLARRVRRQSRVARNSLQGGIKGLRLLEIPDDEFDPGALDDRSRLSMANQRAHLPPSNGELLHGFPPGGTSDEHHRVVSSWYLQPLYAKRHEATLTSPHNLWRTPTPSTMAQPMMRRNAHGRQALTASTRRWLA
jgi:hypothetical protein